jgi:hypothetical protein
MVQAEFVKRFLYGKPKCNLAIDGPIADTGVLRIRWRTGRDNTVHGEPPQKGVLYIDADGLETPWDTLRDRPARSTLKGKRAT